AFAHFDQNLCGFRKWLENFLSLYLKALCQIKKCSRQKKTIGCVGDDDEFDELDDGISVVDLMLQKNSCTMGRNRYRHWRLIIKRMDLSLRSSHGLMLCERWILFGFSFVVTLLSCFSHIISGLAFSLNGEKLLVASGHAQIRILDRQCNQYAETVRDDQYLVDLSNTKGHAESSVLTVDIQL
uniref:Uncharacterized protein n=1 Tax=Wuchereria bancrofti TaxID=6293 RepID=A0A1I8EQV5_WUCBA